MGTNFYMLTKQCDSCGRADRLHVGKSSMGWRMAVRTYDDPYDTEGPKTWDEWKAALLTADSIEDEYGKTVDASALIQRAEAKADGAHDSYAIADGPVDLFAGEFR